MPSTGIISFFVMRTSIFYSYCIFLLAMPSCQTTSHYSYTGISVFFFTIEVRVVSTPSLSFDCLSILIRVPQIRFRFLSILFFFKLVRERLSYLQ